MDTAARKLMMQGFQLRQGEAVMAPIDGQAAQEVSCNDIAALALSIHDYSYFFSLKRNLRIRFVRDLNGSGTQGLFIDRIGADHNNGNLISVTFEPLYSKDDDFLYESDLITDQRKDYEPTVNRGNHRFMARHASMQIEWNGNETRQWRSDIARISKSHNTLAGWIASDSDMLVRCSGFQCSGSKILENIDLVRYAAAGFELEDIKSRLRCSRCGENSARIMTI